MSQVSAVPAASNWRAYAAIFIAFAGFNVAVGLTFGVVGLLIEPLTLEFGASKSQISLSIALVSLIMAASSPVVGVLLDRWSVRGTMLVGCLVNIAAFLLAANAHSTLLFLFAFGVLGGLGFAMIGVLPAGKVVSLWFPHKLGRVSGLVNLSLINAVAPPLYGMFIAAHGWRSLLMVFAAISAGLFVLCLALRVPPKATAAPAAAVGTEPVAIDRPPFKTGIFWLIVVMTLLLTAPGIVAVTYAAAYAQSQQIAPTTAALLLSVLGIASIVGAPFYGWLCDRAGPFRTLLLNGVGQLALWTLLPAMTNFAAMAVMVAGIGLCAGGITPVAIALIGRAFPFRQFGAAMGQLTFAGLPLNFSAAPLAGLLFDLFGNYRGAFWLQAVLAATSLSVLLVYRRRVQSL